MTFFMINSWYQEWLSDEAARGSGRTVVAPDEPVDKWGIATLADSVS